MFGPRSPARHHLRFLAFCLVLALVFPPAALVMRLEEAFALGFDVAALVFIALALPLWLHDPRRDPAAADAQAAGDDGGRLLLPLVALVTACAVLAVVIRMIALRSALTPAGAAGIAVTLVLAWVFANLFLAFHYARIGLASPREIQVPGDAPPGFSDYVYFSFVLGMTCQTADVTIGSARVRRLATLHGVVMFFFNLGVLALTINVLAGVL